MTNYSRKLPGQYLVNRTAIRRVADAIDQLGFALPCKVVRVTNQLVTVNFQVQSDTQTFPDITIPKAEGPWIRSPTQVGDPGLTIPADVYLGGISGQGGGIAKLNRRANLTSLVWVPVASTASPTVNINMAYMAGPEGVLIETSDHHTSILLTETGITFTANGKTWTVTGSGLTMSNGVIAETHIHSQGNDSHGDGEQPTSGPENP